MAEKVFWIIAMPSCLLAFGFAFKYRGLGGAKGDPWDRVLAKGQEHDDWLTCLAIWTGVFTRTLDGRETVLATCAFALVWTAWRSLQRLRRLGHGLHGVHEAHHDDERHS